MHAVPEKADSAFINKSGILPHDRAGSSEGKGNKHIDHPGDLAGGGGAAGTGKTLDRIVTAKEEVRRSDHTRRE